MEVKQSFEYFGLLEQQFWKRLDQKSLQKITFSGELRPEDMLLYGEFGFALLGLKPAVLVEFCDESINRLYLETVIEPVLFAMKAKTLGYHIIRHVKTPESDLNGCILIYQIEQSLHELTAIMSNNNNNNDSTSVTEETMATILDYPGHLPSTEKEISSMLSVVYFHDSRPNKKGLIALTSFAIQTFEREKTLAHFKRYHDACKSRLNIDMKLLIQ